MSVGWVAVGTAVAGAVASADANRKAAHTAEDQQRLDRAAGDAALAEQIRQADELLAFNKQVYEEGKTRQAGIDAITKQVVQQNLAISQKADARADEAYQFYTEKGRPLVEKTFQDAQNYDSAGNILAARARAEADVQQAFDNAEGQSQRALTRLGINPSSGRFMALQQRIAADKAAALAGASTNAENQRREGAIGLRQQAANLAQGFPAQSMGQAGQSANVGNSAVAANGQMAAENLALAGQALGGYSAGANIYGNVANTYQQRDQNWTNQINAINQQAAQSQAGWGNLAGMGLAMMMADGGQVQGPGTGTSDSVPAVNKSNGQPIQLSNGEYVVSADVVRAKGVEFFDKLQAKHHKPVNVGRAA
jgi:hypothetical protein